MNTPNESTADVLERIAAQALADDASDQITLGEFMDKLADRGFGVLILLCALPNFFPVNVPGVSTVFSVILLLLVGQWALGRASPWMPGAVRRRSMSEKAFARGLAGITPRLRRMERWMKPRQQWLFRPPCIWLVALALLLQISFLALPLSMVPFSNALPAYFIAGIALGIITHDGRFTLGAMAVGTIAICLFARVILEVILQLADLVL